VIEVLVIGGPAGVGKSSTAFEVSNQLQHVQVPHALIDTDELDRIYPVPSDLGALTERNLASIWQSFAERGTQRLVLVGVFLHRESELTSVRRATSAEHITLVQLAASDETLRERVGRREIGSAADAQLTRTLRQARELQMDVAADVHVLDTDSESVEETAARILEIAGWP
jgi:2-phosphoglycerate kinase